MPRVRVSRVMAAPPAAVWRRLADLADHATWMADADAIRFVGDSREGVGTRFECDTRVGPLRTVDVMEVTEWSPGEVIGVRHSGIVTGTGRFTLAAVSGGRARLTWVEDLSFPWYLGGPVTAWAATPILRRLWAANLRRFAEHVESAPLAS